MIETRITDPVTIEIDRLRAIIEAGRQPTIQFSKAGYRPELLKEVNRVCAEFQDEIEVRFYGHYGYGFDASALSEIPDARWVSADCLTAITNEQQIGRLPLLNRLSFGVYRFDEPKFLQTINVSQLEQLSLGETAKRNFDLGPLRNSSKLHSLWLAGHTRNVEALCSLPGASEVNA